MVDFCKGIDSWKPEMHNFCKAENEKFHSVFHSNANFPKDLLIDVYLCHKAVTTFDQNSKIPMSWFYLRFRV